MSRWKGLRVLVTGGASFIGSHLVDALVLRGAEVTVVDDLSSGKLENVQHHLTEGTVDFIQADLREPGVARMAVKGIDMVFHLAADHGGRGYVDTHQAGPASNLCLDGLVFWEALKAGVEKVVFASSGCVYPNHLQSDPQREVYLTEELVTPPVSFDVGGVSDAVRHLETGYLARARDVEDLASGIHLLLTDDDLRQKLAHRSREVAESEYTLELQAKRYVAVYQSLMDEQNAN